MSDLNQQCPVCAETIKLEARVCRFCGAKFDVRTVGYCSNCKTVVEANADGQCSICNGTIIDRRIESRLISSAAIKTPGTANPPVDVSPAVDQPVAPVPPKKKAPRVLGTLFSLLVTGVACLFLFSMMYHEGPPIPGVETYFKNIQYETSDAQPIYLLDGIYVWKITNKNDFAWPKAYILYGAEHAFLLDRVEPGQTISFSNILLVNTNSHEAEDVPFLEGTSVELTLVIDFSEETTLPARIRNLLKMPMVHVDLGKWSR
jgi:hypothetical protein